MISFEVYSLSTEPVQVFWYQNPFAAGVRCREASNDKMQVCLLHVHCILERTETSLEYSRRVVKYSPGEYLEWQIRRLCLAEKDPTKCVNPKRLLGVASPRFIQSTAFQP